MCIRDRYELDQNWIGIRTLQVLGLAWDVKIARIKQPLPDEAVIPAGEAVA